MRAASGLLLSFVAAGWYALPLWAAETVAPVSPVAVAPLDCEAAVAFVLAEHPTVRAARSGAVAARAAADIMRWLRSPELRVRSDAGTRDDQTRVGVRLPVPGPGVPSAQARAAEARIGLSAAEADALSARLAAEVRLDYAAARFARRERAAREQLAARARARLRAVRSLTDIGAASALVKESAELTAAEADEEVDEARAREELANGAVMGWTGLPAAPEDAPCALPLDVALEDAVAHHPAVRIAQADAAAATEEALIARRQRWLWPSFVEVTWVREQQNDSNGVLLQTGVRLPLPSDEAAAAEAREQAARFELRGVETRVRADIAAAMREYEAARAELERLEAAAGEVARAQELVLQGEQAGADPDELWRLDQQIARRQQRMNEAVHRAELRRIDLRLKLGIQ